MFVLFALLLSAIEGIRAAFSRLTDKLLHAFRLRPRSHLKCPPQANSKDDLAMRLAECPVIITGHHTPLEREIVACPSVLPMVTPPIQECLAIGVKSGSQAARALFHDSFQPISMSPMGVFEISSNAFSPPRESMAASISFADFQSPSSSNGSESQFTPMFDLDPVNSPYEDASTAPTSPASDIFYLANSITVEGDVGRSAELRTEDDIPLSALMIQGVESKAAKRNGVSGALLAKGKDTPLWVPDATQASTLNASTSLPDANDAYQRWEEVDIGNSALRMSTELPETPGGSRVVSLDIIAQDPKTPLNHLPPSWNNWTTDTKSPGYDEESVYSMDSYIPRRLSQDVRLSWAPPIVPQITLTPPSLPTSPSVPDSYVRDSIPLFDDDSPRGLTDAIEGASGHLHPSSLLAPFNDPVPRPPSPCLIADVGDEDEALTKRRRRNGCRLNTSSIDIIMAGLDQQFPDTPIGSPVMKPAVYGDPIHFDIGAQARINPGMAEGGNEPSPLEYLYSPPTSPSTTVRHSVGDLSGETLLFEENFESKFSDDSSDDDDEDSELYKAFSKIAKRDSWRSSRVSSFFNACSMLSTIFEEDEGTVLSRASKVDVPALGSPAIIRDGRRFSGTSADTVRPTGQISKKRWLSMIEDKAKREPLRGMEQKQRPTSTPLLSLLGTRSTVNLASPPRALVRARASSGSRPLFLPQRGVKRHSNPIPQQSSTTAPSLSGIRNSSGEFCLPSSRSSSCISVYQRPWSLYSPRKVTLIDVDSDCSIDGGASSPEDSSKSTASSPTTSVSTPDSATAELEPEHDSIEVPLFLDEGCPGMNGLGGILAILDSANFSEAQWSGAAPMNDSNAKDDMETVADADDMGDNDDESDTATVRWSEVDFAAYYAGGDESNGDIVAGIAV